MLVHQGFGYDINGRLSCIRIERKYADIVDRRSYAQRGIRRKGPWRSGPCYKAYRHVIVTVKKVRNFVSDDFELYYGGGILHVPVASRLIQLVRTQPCPCGRRIRLDGITLIQKPLSVDIFQQIPQSFYIAVVISDIRIVHVHPVADLLGQGHPLPGVFHHFLAAGIVVFLYTYLVSDIFLGYSQHLLHAQLYREAMRVPSCTSVHLEAALGLVPAYGILYGSGHHVMDARHTVRGWRSFEKDEFRSAFPHFERASECIVPLPSVQHLVSCRHQVQTFIFLELHSKFCFPYPILFFVSCHNLFNFATATINLANII